MKLTNEQVKKRIIRLRNFERLYPIARERIELLEQENKGLKEQVKLLKIQSITIEKLKLRIEELEKIIFGKRSKKKPVSENQRYSSKIKNFFNRRTSESYRRPIPGEQEITDFVDYRIKRCPDCNSRLEDVKTIVRYSEDIRLLENVLKKIEKQHIQTGYCPSCKKRFSSKPIPHHKVCLGENAKQFISYSNVVLRLSYQQTQNLIKDLFNINVSDGEIARILEQQAQKLTYQYNKLQNNIRGQPAVHYDETGWSVSEQYQGKWAWVMTGSETTDTVFKIGRSRGKGNAEELKGASNEQIAVTDDYGAYRNLFGDNHQLCWSHILRKTKDLSDSQYLSPDKKRHCFEVYQSLSNLHQRLKGTLSQPFDMEKRTRIRLKMIERVVQITQPSKKDPDKLKTFKQTLLKNRGKYFTCLMHENIPTTNNKAERALRHLVLKRKISFGSKTQKGADVMSILCSVLLSLWWSKPKNFFREYSLLLNSA